MNTVKQLVLSSLFVVATPALADVSQTIEKTFEVGDSSQLILENVNGDVTISSWDQSKIMVTAVKVANDQDALDRMQVILKQSGDRVVVETEYKSDEGWGKNANGGSIEFTVKVPTNAKLRDIDLVNGSLQVNDVAGELNVDIVNGSVEATGLASDVEIDSVNGGVELKFSNTASNIDIDVETVNGGIRLYLPSDFSAEIDASTGNGAIKTEFGLQGIKGKYYGTDLEGTIGNGDANIDLDSVNGSIRILKN
ncbi:DUF4097 domain-containing protein [Thalassotalea maritima]|uniref:DUF4097 family beta strand repeat-containing protein n=1 Tax=Thalassotalea maritima TaxID=3242416 RepID=UPI0035281BE8